MYGTDKIDPKEFPSDKGTEDLVDRGDEGLDEEEEEQEEAEKPAKKTAKPAKKAAEDEESEEDDEESEEDDDEDEEEEEPEKKKASSVPVSVLRKAQQKRRDAEERVKQLEDQLKAQNNKQSERGQEQFEKLTKRMEELYEQVEEARAEGKSAIAAKLQRELDGIKDKMTSAQASALATRQALQNQSLHAYNALVAELEIIDPRFDQEDDEYDEDLVDRVSDATEAYEAKGLVAPDALRKALRMVMGNDPFREARRLTREAAKKSAAAPEKAKPRKTDVQKNLEAKRKQPPEDGDKTKERPGKINVATLSDEDWAKLPKSKIRELRGDFG